MGTKATVFSGRAHTRLLLLTGAAAAALGLAVSPAQARADAVDSQVDAVTITARREQRLAEQEKHAATIVAEVVDAQQLSALPVNSVVDGLKRVPGISVVTSYGNAEPRYITVRGLDSAYNVYTLNGVRLPTADDSRSVALDLFAPDAISSVRIVKTVTPDLDGDALGATVDIRTASPFDHPDGLVTASARVGYDESTDKAPLDLSAAFSTFLDREKRLGVFVTGFYSERTTIAARNTNPSQDNSWRRPDGSSDTIAVPASALKLASHGLDQFTNNITKLGGDVMVEFRPDDANRFYLRGSYERWKNPQRHDYINVLKNFNSSGRENGFGMLMGAEIKEEDNRLGSISFGGENKSGEITASYDFSYSYGRVRTPQQYYMEFTTEAATDPIFGSNISFQTANPRYPKWVLSDDQAKAMYNIDNLHLSEAKLYHRTSEDNQLFGRADLSWKPTGAELLREVKGGLRIRRASRRYSQHMIADNTKGAGYELPGVKIGTALSGAPYLLGGTIDSYQDQYSGNTRLGTILNMDQALRLLEAAPVVTDDVYTWNLNRRSGVEESYSGYGMAVIGGESLSATVGARYEYTKIHNQFLATIKDDAGKTTRVFGGPKGTADSNYSNFLPSLHVNWRPDARWAIRGAAWTSFARPNFVDISAAITETRSGGITYISQGNPNLRPSKAINLDASADYLAGDTVLTAAAFFKSIDGFMYARAQTATTTTGGNVVITQPVNGKTAKVWGIELAARRPLVAGFALNGNFTWQHSEADPGGTGRVPGKVSLPNAPEIIYNAGLSYEKDRWGGDLNYNYQGKRLTVLRPSGLDEWNQGVGVLDASIRYRPNDTTTVSLSGKNLTKQPSYWGTRGEEQIATVAYQTAARVYYLNVTFRH